MKMQVFYRWKQRARQLKSDIPAVYLALKDPKTPFAARILAGITILYALSPIDLIPDFIPVLGYLDDLILLPALAAATLKLIPEDVLKTYREEAAGLWQNGKPKKWYFALPVIFIWIILVVIILKIFI